MADNCIVEPIQGQPEAKCIPNESAPLIDWISREETSPFLNRRNCEYSIVVDKSYPNYNDLSRPAKQYGSLGDNPDERIRGYLAYGVDKLLEYYFKANEIPSTQREILLVQALRTYTESDDLRYHISERPGSFVKVLVTLPYEILFNMPDRAYTPRYDATNTRVVRFDTRLLKAKVEFVANVISDNYGEKFAFNGQLGPIPKRTTFASPASWAVSTLYGNREPGEPSIDLKNEAFKMKAFLDDLQRLIRDNNIDINLSDIVTSRREFIDIVLNLDDYQLLDIRHVVSEGQVQYMRKGWSRISSNTTQTTSALLYWTKAELFIRFNNHVNPTWNEFVERYIYPPHDTSIYRIDLSGIETGTANILQEVREALRERDNAIREAGQYSTGQRSVIPLLDQYIKSESDLLTENNGIFDRTFQEALAYRTANINRQTDLKETLIAELADAANLENLYHDILSSYDVRYLAAQVAECAGLQIIFPDLLEVLRNIAEFLKQLPDMLQITIDFPFDLYDLILDITKELASYVASLLVGLVESVIAELVLGLLSAFERLCEEDFNYGSIDLSTLVSREFSPQEAQDFYRALASNTGAGNAAGNLLRDMMQDISLVLSVKEMCALLSGTATREILRIVHNIILRDTYSVFHNKFKNLQDVSVFFASLGSLLNPEICEIGTLVPGKLCEDGFNETLRRQLLSNKPGVQRDNVDELIAEEKRKRQELISTVNDLINSESNALAAKFEELYDERVVAEQIARHPGTRDTVSQMIQSTFVGPIITMVNEGMGALETPFSIIESGFEPPGIDILARSQEQLPVNTGIMDIVSNLEGYAFYSYGDTNGNILGRTGAIRNANTNGVESADGAVELLSRFNLNFNTNPDGRGGSSNTYYFSGETPNVWNYNTRLYPVLGGYTNTLAQTFTISYDVSATAPSWWTSELFEDGARVDNPQVTTAFIKRNPISGFPSGDSLERDTVEGPILRDTGLLQSLYPTDPSVIESENDEFIRSSRRVKINVFNDLPKVIEEGLSPSLEDYAAPPVGSEYTSKEIYANHIVQEIKKAITEMGASELETEYTNPVKVAAIANTHQNMMSDVMRVLYKLTADSHFNQDPKQMVPALRKKFKDSNQINILMGLNAIQENVEEALASSLVSSTSMAQVSRQVMGEASLRFMIRIYIVEMFLKNIYSFVTFPEIAGYFGNTIIKRPGFIPRVATLDIQGEYRGRIHEFFNRVLDVTDIADPLLVSYIYESIEYSTRVVGGCTTYRNLALQLAGTEREEAGEEFIAVTPDDENGDTLAYFPSRTGGTSYEAALKYYIAKELKTFLRDFQEFTDLTSFQTTVDGPTEKRNIMGSFLDKIQTVGYNTTRRHPTDATKDWISYGEGLYMDFYIRVGRINLFFNNPVAIAHRDIADNEYIGLRMAIRDSDYHINERDADPVNLNLLLISLYNAAAREGSAGLTQTQSYNADVGIPILNVELTWGEVKRRLNITNNRPYENPTLQRRILDEMKRELMQLPEFRVLFEYVFPVKKLYNYLMIIMDQNSSAFLTNTEIRGLKLEEEERSSILNASCIDPEQFRAAKLASKSILENLYNSDNYRYVNSDVEEVGGIANLALKNSLDDF